jgi:histidinol-phosphatase (PHP family)
MYNYTDSHLHSNFSWDARQSIDEIIDKAKTDNIKYLTLTEHLDFYPNHQQNHTKFNYDGYSKAITEGRKKFSELMKGFEAGEPHIFRDEYEKFIKGKDIDFIMGSMHHIGAFTPVYDEYFKQYKNGYDAYKTYFDEVYKLAEYGNFDALGHLTLVHRRGAAFYPEFTYEKFKNEIDDILKALISNKVGIEINTSGLRYVSNDILPGADIIKAYMRLGGDIITVGSDSHYLKDTFFGIPEAYKIFDSIGVKEITVFKDRKPFKIKLKE